MQIKNKLSGRYAIAMIAILLFILISPYCFASVGARGARADTSANYTGVFEDLQKDPSFKAENYPVVAGDNSLQVITIAESENGELFIYAYHPGGKPGNRPATSINISTVIDDSKHYQNYILKQLSVSGTLAKYVASGFEVKADKIRYYSIPSILRAWDKAIDSKPGGDNKVVEVPYTVGKLFTATTANGEVSYTCTEEEVVNITDKFVGHLMYTDGFYLLAAERCDSHFVAFSTDHDIDKLFEADIEYMEQNFDWSGVETYPFSNQYRVTRNDSDAEAHKEEKTLTYTEVGENDGSGLFGKKYKWNRIQSVTEFINSEDITAEAKQELNNKQWVLRFSETPNNFSRVPAAGLTCGTLSVKFTEISEVMILRLKFETEGKVYNLGVVDNKQTGSRIPVNGRKDYTYVLLILTIVLTAALIIALFYKIFCKDKNEV